MKYKLAFILLILVSCNKKQSINQESIDLYELAKSEIIKMGYPYLNSEKAQEEFELIKTFDQSLVLNRRFDYFEQLLFSGQNQKCIDQMESHMKLAWPENKINRANFDYFKLLALAYLRQGELQNCISNHNAESCIFPLKNGGIHSDRSFANEAFAIYQRLLDFESKDEEALWLINIAAMASDQFGPKKSKYLLPMEAIESSQPLSRFHDVASGLGLDVMGRAGGTAMEDFNNDGILDIFCTSYGLDDQCKLFIGDGQGSFMDATETYELNGIKKSLNFITGDYNNDGYVDILLLRGGWLQSFGKFPNSLLKNVRGEYFVDVTREAGLLSFSPTQTAAFGDIDLDGDLDLFIGNEYYGDSRIRSQLFVNQGNGTFSDESEKWGIDLLRYIKACVFSDFNNDLFPDLYLSVYGGDNVLLINQNQVNKEERFFVDESQSNGIRSPKMSFSVMSFDINNDGNEDIIVSSYDNTGIKRMLGSTLQEYLHEDILAEKMAVYINNGRSGFTDNAEEYGLDKSFLTMGCNFGDIDNDGWIDFYLGTGEFSLPASVPNRMFKNVNGIRFADVTTAGGFGQIQKGHGVSFGDLDNDGDQDIYHNVGGALEGDVYQNMLLENPGTSNNWVVLSLQGQHSNRKAIGARVWIKVSSKEQSREIWRTVSTGGSFGNNSLQLEIGLEQYNIIDSLKIFWPHSSLPVSEFSKIEVNKKYVVREGLEIMEEIEYSPISFSPKEYEARHEH